MQCPLCLNDPCDCVQPFTKAQFAELRKRIIKRYEATRLDHGMCLEWHTLTKDLNTLSEFMDIATLDGMLEEDDA